jgi:hypothetical protein
VEIRKFSPTLFAKAGRYRLRHSPSWQQGQKRGESLFQEDPSRGNQKKRNRKKREKGEKNRGIEGARRALGGQQGDEEF